MLSVDIIPAFSDNYIYLLRDEASGSTAVVDPGEAAPVLTTLKDKDWKLDHIWSTHHHADHIGGNEKLIQKTNCKVWASAYDSKRISPGVDYKLNDRDVFHFGKTEVQVWHIPGHTLGHIAFYIPEENKIFSGDTLFSFGCGRLFEGTYEQMFESLQRFKQLPDEVDLYCGHEYTLKNLEFCIFVEDTNELRTHYKKIEEKIRSQGTSLPSKMADEKKWNPFLKAKTPEEFKSLRLRKDQLGTG